MLVAGCILCFFSCKKSGLKDPKELPLAEKEHREVLDSIFLYARQIYLWNDQLPSEKIFNAGKYGMGGMDVYRKEIADIAQFALNPQTGRSFEYNLLNPSSAKFSTIIKKSGSESGKISTQINLNDIGYDYGITFLALNQDEIYIEYIIPNSPAGLAGLKRGMKLEKLNGRRAETSTGFYDEMQKAFKNAALELSLSNPGLADPSQNYALRKTAYQAEPLNKAVVLNVKKRKIGYISYLKFTSPKGLNQSLDQVFRDFKEEGVEELIVDLRYNGGGDISSCEHFANLVAPFAANGKVMRKEKYNSLMQAGKASILSAQLLLNDDGIPAFYINGRPATLADGDYSLEGNTELFQKTAGLPQLQRVYFIVSNQTASASELLINCLRPYMNVKLVGVRTNENAAEPVKTFGKPIGFFSIRLKSYLLYLSLFQNLNALGEGDYFNGISVDMTVTDDVSVDFGDIKDPGIQTALTDMGYVSVGNAQRLSNTPPNLKRMDHSFLRREINPLTGPHDLIKSRIKMKRP
ncbi:hypothetical protein DBR43_24990 [Pedobacter sp. KBW06]|nr:hypothetical protein DBR43_24990 [Pedobacter sp. KBW06]